MARSYSVRGTACGFQPSRVTCNPAADWLTGITSTRLTLRCGGRFAIHLFGDTDAVNVRLDGDRFRFAQPRRGDTADPMPDSVGYGLNVLRAACAHKFAAADSTGNRAEGLGAAREAGLAACTGLSD